MAGLFDGTRFERPVTCEVCERPLADCRCPRGADGKVKPAADQPARVSRERRAGGKIVTVIAGLDPVASDLAGLLKRFKTLCAAGGTVADGCIEIQGDHRERLVAALREMGYPAKSAL